MFRLGSLDRRILRNWLPIAFIATLLIGLVYVVGQQILRQNANDPQIQLSEDIADTLSNGTPVDSVIPVQRIDATASLATFVTVYDSTGHVTSTTGKLGNNDPVLPSGVLEYTAKHTEDRFTWQPQANVTIAAVVRHYKTKSGVSGFVLAGRNLREVEQRENSLLIFVSITWAIAMAGSLGLRLLLTSK